MNVYHGKRDPNDELENKVWFVGPDGDARELPLRLDLRNHSPTGFEWGYYGSGPAQLALALLAAELGDEWALKLYQEYKAAVVSKLPRAEWQLTSAEVRRVADEIAAAAVLRGNGG